MPILKYFLLRPNRSGAAHPTPRFRSKLFWISMYLSSCFDCSLMLRRLRCTASSQAHVVCPALKKWRLRRLCRAASSFRRVCSATCSCVRRLRSLIINHFRYGSKTSRLPLLVKRGVNCGATRKPCRVTCDAPRKRLYLNCVAMRHLRRVVCAVLSGGKEEERY